MQSRPAEILLVEPDEELSSMMSDCLRAAMSASITIVPDANEALREELTTRHDVLLISNTLPEGAWVDLVREIRTTNKCPILLLAEQPSTEDVLLAMRNGVMDVVLKPFDLAEFCARVENACQLSRARQRTRTRHRRLRRLTTRIIRERRDLRQRIDLICRDFVQAYRRLAQRVTETELLSK